ncbi:MAG TPA: hypothetical protein VIK51_24355 [Vicinamibacteria bacterium]|jgi:hypothetical protein
MHAHVFASDARWKARVGNLVTGQEMVATDEPAHRDATFAAMKRARIVKAMVSGDYEAVLRWKQAAPDQVIVGYSFDDPEKVDLGFLRKEKAAGRLDALGEVGSQYAGVAPNDPRMTSGSRRYGRAWATHCGWRTCWCFTRGCISTSCTQAGRSWKT